MTIPPSNHAAAVTSKAASADPLSSDIPTRENRLIDRRQVWAANRFWMEIDNLKSKRYGNKSHHHWYALLIMMKTFQLLLRLTGLYQRGVDNASKIELRNIPLYFPNLPSAFNGFTLLHLSDLHLDVMPDIEKNIVQKLEGREVDLCVMTGDYRTKFTGTHLPIVKKLSYLVDNIKSRNGFIGTLGNHDNCHLVNPMEQMGIITLVNSVHHLTKNGQHLQFAGTDDVHYYYTEQALHTFEHADKSFTIALVHSPELFDAAAEMGVDLYLCGHTHAGQVCLPGGHALIKHLNRGHKYFKGHWTHNHMQGYTNAGAGTSGIPVRFNTRGEIVIFTLKTM